MHQAQEAELRRNFNHFQTVVRSLMANHAGEYALLHDGSVIDLYAKPGQAVEAGHSMYADGWFSIQRVVDHPLDLGFMAYGATERIAD